MTKYKIGSEVLCLDNCKDTDYVILTEECDYKKVFENGEDIFYTSVEHLTNRLTYKSKDKTMLIYNYQYDRDIIGQDFPIEYHILDYKDNLIEYLKIIVNRKMFNFNRRITLRGGNCSKQLYHVAYNMFICQNNSTSLTEEQKEIIQKLHDGVMPISYLDEMEKIINNL